MYCVNPEPGQKDFVVLHTNGIHYVAVDFCNCEHRVPNRQQLLHRKWFLVTVHYPQTCCTIEVLQQYHILTLTGKLSGHDFYKTLERLTDNSELTLPKVSRRAVDVNMVFSTNRLTVGNKTVQVFCTFEKIHLYHIR